MAEGDVYAQRSDHRVIEQLVVYHLQVGHHEDLVVGRTQPRGAERNLHHGAVGALYDDIVPDAKWLVQQYGDPGNNVLKGVPGREADGNAGKAQTEAEAGKVETDVIQHRDGHDREAHKPKSLQNERHQACPDVARTSQSAAEQPEKQPVDGVEEDEERECAQELRSLLQDELGQPLVKQVGAFAQLARQQQLARFTQVLLKLLQRTGRVGGQLRGPGLSLDRVEDSLLHRLPAPRGPQRVS